MKILIAVLLATATVQAQTKPEKPWLDAQTKIELAAVGGTIAADAWTTRKYAYSEINPIARPFFKSDAGEVFISGAGFASMVLGNYFLRGHPRIRHTANWVTIGFEGWLAIHNSRLRTRFLRPIP